MEIKTSDMFRHRELLMCVAIIGVVFYHLALRGIPIGRLNIGYIGVDIFMLLSGYGISKSLQHNTIIRFYKNRVRRILPMWILIISLSWLISSFGGGNKHQSFSCKSFNNILLLQS